MKSTWWRTLDKDRGSRPISVQLAHATRLEFADRMTGLVGLSDVTVSANDFWMPRGGPVWTPDGWNREPAAMQPDQQRLGCSRLLRRVEAVEDEPAVPPECDLSRPPRPSAPDRCRA